MNSYKAVPFLLCVTNLLHLGTLIPALFSFILMVRSPQTFYFAISETKGFFSRVKSVLGACSGFSKAFKPLFVLSRLSHATDKFGNFELLLLMIGKNKEINISIYG